MAFTLDCSSKITGEHYISRAVLSALGDTLVCTGLPWLAPGESASYGKNSLTANVLCDRHNSALSPIDAAAEQFFLALQSIANQLGRKAWSKKISIVRAVRGELIELWALKTLMGIYHAGIAQQEGLRLRDHFQLPLAPYCAALAGESMRAPHGMYVFTALNHRFKLENSVAMAPLTKDGAVAGLAMLVAGHDIIFLFPPVEAHFYKLSQGHTYRPSDLVFISSHTVDERLFILKLGWASAAPATITFTHESGAST